MEWVRTRIKRSEVVIGDLTGVNPNVCLEVGYAWGCGVRTILVAPEARELPFDLRGQKILEYKSIKHLEDLLTYALKSLGEQ